MSNFRTITQPSFLIALTIFIVSVLVTFLSYAEILRREESKEVFQADIALGDSRVFLISNGKCVGSLTTKLEKPSSEYRLSSNGKIRIGWFNQQASPEITVEAQFNSLNQLGAGFFKIANGPNSILIASKNVNPIILILKGTLLDRTFYYEFEIPGPLELRPKKGKSFTLQYPQLRNIQSSTMDLLSQPVFKQIDLKLERENPATPQCKGNESAQLDLAPIVSNIQELAAKLTPGFDWQNLVSQ